MSQTEEFDVHDILAELNLKVDEPCTVTLHFRPGSLNTQATFPNRKVLLEEMLEEAAQFWISKCRVIAETYEPELQLSCYIGDDQEEEAKRLNEKQIIEDKERTDALYTPIQNENQWKKELAARNDLLILARVVLHEKISAHSIFNRNSRVRQELTPMVQRFIQENQNSATESQLLQNYVERCKEIEEQEQMFDNFIDSALGDFE